MNIAMPVLSVFLLVTGLFFIITPYAMKRVNDYCNRIIFTDSKFFMGRRLGGMIFIIFGIISFFSTKIWGEFMWGGAKLILSLKSIGIISFLIGILFIIKPILLIRISTIGNKVLFTDEKIETHPRIFGSIILAVGLTILYELLTKM